VPHGLEQNLTWQNAVRRLAIEYAEDKSKDEKPKSSRRNKYHGLCFSQSGFHDKLVSIEPRAQGLQRGLHNLIEANWTWCRTILDKVAQVFQELAMPHGTIFYLNSNFFEVIKNIVRFFLGKQKKRFRYKIHHGQWLIELMKNAANCVRQQCEFGLLCHNR
jgi:hypothetical protein